MGRKSKDKAKEKEKVPKSTARRDNSSRDLPSIAEEDVIQSRKETLASVVNATTVQVQTMAVTIALQGRTIEALTLRVTQLESWRHSFLNGQGSKIPIVDLEVVQTRSMREILRDVAADSGLKKALGPIDVDAYEFSCGRKNVYPDNSSKTCKRKLEFVTFSTEDMNILYLIKQRGFGTPFAFWSHNRTEMTAEETPLCLDLAFRPPAGMRFVGMELAVAAYIFTNAGESTERLYQDTHCDSTQLRFCSLLPGCELYDDVLNIVVGMCTGGKADKRKWWLPTTFSHMLVHPKQFDQATMDYIVDRYMSKADDLHQIYVPMHIGRHWYLLIISVWDKKLVYLDSLKFDDVRETEARVEQIMTMACYVEQMVKDKSFSEAEKFWPPYVSEFEPFVPEVGSQAPGLMDCGMWVCQWMMNSHLWLDYNLEEINDSSRMALAVDLVTHPTNPLADVIWERAVNYWDAEMLRNYREETGRRVNSRSPPGSGSTTI
ncbi:hypothetical protein PIB30_011764 [Stylosanthes scabra]|uniref:Ubiquitin-like protease family profile domain-containing protein n=1 Tax=Stylosanthes scabra TaxID=79078 RepID=A0ABU6Q6W3_9FABA|nr:hypothetical protein [Stylosanthes scabra]